MFVFADSNQQMPAANAIMEVFDLSPTHNTAIFTRKALSIRELHTRLLLGSGNLPAQTVIVCDELQVLNPAFDSILLKVGECLHQACHGISVQVMCGKPRRLSGGGVDFSLTPYFNPQGTRGVLNL